jgi:hypothetical protein
MRYIDLTEDQQRDLNIFNLILEYHDWVDLDECERRMDHGDSVSPEGRRLLCNGDAILDAQFHAPLNMISLQITDLQSFEKVRFHFMFDEKPERLLEWLAEACQTLSFETYPEWLKGTEGKCEMILLDLGKNELYELKPPTSTIEQEA